SNDSTAANQPRSSPRNAGRTPSPDACRCSASAAGSGCTSPVPKTRYQTAMTTSLLPGWTRPQPCGRMRRMVPDPAYFPSDYAAARERFRAPAARGCPTEPPAVAGRGPSGEELTTDVAWLGPERAPRVVVLSSGLHGAEGFLGTAVQLACLAEPPTMPPGTGLLL